MQTSISLSTQCTYNPANGSTHSGLITYIKTSLQSTKLINFTHQNSQTWEGMFIEIGNLDKTVIIGNIGLRANQIMISLSLSMN